MHRVVLIGCGNMGRVHARHWKSVPNAQIVGVVALDDPSASAFAHNGRAPLFATLAQAVETAAPTIVDICVPTPSHKALALESLSAGLHTFLEKPMARNVADCDEMIAAQQKAGVVMMVGHVLRFFPEYETAHGVVASGKLGCIAAARTSRLAAHPTRSWHDWYGDPAQSGGAVLDLMIHDIDWMRWCFGDVDRVFAKGLYNQPEFVGRQDYALVTLHFKSGTLGHIAGSWAHSGGFRTQFEVCGDAGMIEHDSATSIPLNVAVRERETNVGVTVPQSPLFDLDDPYYRELAHFAHCIETGDQPRVTLADARAAVQIATAALESITTGLPITL